MENTVAFGVLMELISVLGSFVTTPMFFGLSVINILVISFIFNMVIGICLGGVSPRARIVNNDNRTVSVNQERVLHFHASDNPSIGVGNQHLLGGGK